MSLKNGASARARFGQLKNKYAVRTNEDIAGPSDHTHNLPPASAGSKRKAEFIANDTDDEDDEGAKNTAKRSKGGAELKAKGKVTLKAKPQSPKAKGKRTPKAKVRSTKN
jgi:hypothetical protein